MKRPNRFAKLLLPLTIMMWMAFVEHTEMTIAWATVFLAGVIVACADQISRKPD